MKPVKNIIRFFALAMGLFISFVSFAQENSTDINVTLDKEGGEWYSQPWVWIVGVAVFILLLVALLRGTGNRTTD
ncbi:MAG TPA: hypothetical protein VEB42_05645 [Chitinophagaceae bacterium]|nr:hypothetical protein [Chitinophagaceae bacterium]